MVMVMAEVSDELVREDFATALPWSAKLDRVQPSSVQSSSKRELEERQAPALPMTIEGGFAGVAADLDRRGRDWTTMVRLLEQQRLQLESAENERTRLYAALQAAMPRALESRDSLNGALEATKQGDISSNLSTRFAANLTELDELENIAKALTANLLWTRSSWEQYARSVLGAQKMRESITD
jgi:hypothetical protein